MRCWGLLGIGRSGLTGGWWSCNLGRADRGTAEDAAENGKYGMRTQSYTFWQLSVCLLCQCLLGKIRELHNFEEDGRVCTHKCFIAELQS